MGKKKVLVVVLFTLAAGSVLGALANSIGVMIVARVIQGVGAAVLPLSFGIIRDEAPAHKVGPNISITAALIAVGGGAGIVLAGPIVSFLDFHWLFWIPSIAVGLAAIASLVVVPESQSRSPGHVAVAPSLLFSGWLVALILAVSEGQNWGWTGDRTLGLLAATIVLAALWIRVELRVAQPLIDMRMMRLPAVWTTNLAAALYGIGLYAAIAFLPQFLQTPRRVGYGFGATPTTSGIFLAPEMVTMFICGMLASHLAARFGSKRVLFLGSLSTVFPYAILAFANNQRWEIYLATVFLGAGLGFGFAAMSNLIVESVPAHQVGVASGMNVNIRTIGGTIGAAVMATIVTASAKAGGLPKEFGYRNGFIFLMISGVLATVACIIIPRARRNEETLLAEAAVVVHGETAMVAGAALVDEL